MRSLEGFELRTWAREAAGTTGSVDHTEERAVGRASGSARSAQRERVGGRLLGLRQDCELRTCCVSWALSASKLDGFSESVFTPRGIYFRLCTTQAWKRRCKLPETNSGR